MEVNFAPIEPGNSESDCGPIVAVQCGGV